jgi:hypothetical protein
MERRKAIWAEQRWERTKFVNGERIQCHYEPLMDRNGWVHGFFQAQTSDTDAAPCAVFELQDGSIVEILNVAEIRFADWSEEDESISDIDIALKDFETSVMALESAQEQTEQ